MLEHTRVPIFPIRVPSGITCRTDAAATHIIPVFIHVIHVYDIHPYETYVLHMFYKYISDSYILYVKSITHIYPMYDLCNIHIE